MRRPLQLAQFPNFIKNTQDLWLFTKMWPVPEPRGIVFICHGYGEHILRYFQIFVIILFLLLPPPPVLPRWLLGFLMRSI